MATLSALRTDLQTRYQDKNAGFLSSTPANLYINMACEDFVNDCQPMSREYGYYITQYQYRYDLPSDFINFRGMMWYYGGQDVEVPYKSPQEFKALGLMNKRSPSSKPEAYTIIDDDIYIGPAPSASGNTSTLNGAIASSSAVTIAVASASQFHGRAGIALVGSEQIYYQNADTTTNDLKLCIRGSGGTTAATHLTGVTISRLDMVFLYAYAHTYMTQDGQSPAFSSRFHRLIINYALHLALKQGGQDEEAADSFEIYQTQKMQAKREIRRQSRDVSNRRIRAVYS